MIAKWICSDHTKLYFLILSIVIVDLLCIKYEPFGLGRFATDRCYAPQVNGRFAAFAAFAASHFIPCRMLYTLLSTIFHSVNFVPIIPVEN